MKLRTRSNFHQECDEIHQDEATSHNTTAPTICKAKEKRNDNARAQRSHLQKLKANPAKYNQFRVNETRRLLTYRRHRNEAQISRDRETAKNRMRALRQRRKDTGEPTNVKPKKKTRSEVKEQQDKWRRSQRDYRASLSSQKKRRILEMRRGKYAGNEQKTTTVTTPVLTPFQTNAAQRKALSRSWRVAPKSPDKFAEVMSQMITKSTPRKQAALKRKGIIDPSGKKRLTFLQYTNLKPVFDHIKKSRRKDDTWLRRTLYKYICIKNGVRKTTARHQLGLSWAFLSKPTHLLATDYRKKRLDALSQDTVEKVLKFYDLITREMPNTRLVRNNQPTKFMECTMKTAFSEFQQEYSNVSLSFSKFCALRPRNVKPVSKTKLMQCLCEYCINIDFKIEALYKKSMQLGNVDAIIHHKYQASAATLCASKGMFPEKKCIDRECAQCGVNKISHILQPFLKEHGNVEIKWKCWRNVAYTKTGKDGSVSQAKHFVLKENVGTITKLFQELTEELQPFAKHLANAKWQGKKFEDLKTNLPKDWLLTCMDFGQNYNCHFQDEAQSAHWSYQQATIHPIVAYYHCHQCQQPMHESCIFISNDLKHDYHAVQHFVTVTNQYLVNEGHIFKHQVQFSDGSPTQYKSKIPFSDASHGSEDFGWQVQKHFFGTRHGKGPCDGEIGVVKKCALTAVRSRRVVISNAHDLFLFGKDNLTEPKQENDHVHRKRTFFFVADGDINRARSDRTDGIKPVHNTRLLHSFIGNEPFILATRERSCFCDACTGITPGQICANTQFTGEVNLVSLQTGKSTLSQSTQIDSSPVPVHIVVPPLLVQIHVPSTETSPVQTPQSVSKIDLCSPSDENITLSPSTQINDCSTGPAHMVVPPSLVQIHNASSAQTSPVQPPQPASQIDLCSPNDRNLGQEVYQNGAFVAVKLFGKQSCSIYMGEVLGQDDVGQDIHLRFMKRCGKDLYLWPPVRDESWEPRNSIVCPVRYPELANKREQFRFHISDMEKVQTYLENMPFKFM